MFSICLWSFWSTTTRWSWKPSPYAGTSALYQNIPTISGSFGMSQFSNISWSTYQLVCKAVHEQSSFIIRVVSPIFHAYYFGICQRIGPFPTRQCSVHFQLTFNIFPRKVKTASLPAPNKAPEHRSRRNNRAERCKPRHRSRQGLCCTRWYTQCTNRYSAICG